MEKSQSGSASPVQLGSSPASKSTPPIPEALSELEDNQRRPEPLTTRSSRTAAEALDSERSPLNIAQAATSTISEWFGKLAGQSREVGKIYDIQPIKRWLCNRWRPLLSASKAP